MIKNITNKINPMINKIQTISKVTHAMPIKRRIAATNAKLRKIIVAHPYIVVTPN
ncbi:hypothetical protein [Nitrosococcus wardiae]|uniref:hypothetical protein n=1 Tax=Nitrosococcus wardiae TaxID=1814290 RepID=UPI00141BC214